MQVHSLTNSDLSILYAELNRKPDGEDTVSFIRESKPHLSNKLVPLLELYPRHNSTGFLDSYAQFCRDIVYRWIEVTDPPVFRSAHYGREVVLNSVLNFDRDLHDIFRHAQLLGSYEPGGFVDSWWCSISDLAQQRSFDQPDLDKSKLGRKGELLVLQNEKKLCRNLVGNPTPELVSFEDNFKGWDITSFRDGSGTHSKIYLEVKTTTNDRTFFLTWREARMAKILGAEWQLVVVSVIRKEVCYYHSRSLLSVIPFPEADGIKWEKCEISFDLLKEEEICLKYSIQEF